MKNIFLFPLVALFIFLCSCNKDAGIGGESSISGKVYKVTYASDYSTNIDTVADVDDDVFIIYGDTIGTGFYDDKVKTSYDGTFEFKYLRKGKYTIFISSKDTASSNQKIPVFKKVELTSNKDVVNCGDLYIYNRGLSLISGKLLAIDYYNANYEPKSPPYRPYPAAEERIYITYNNDIFYFNNVRTNYDGSFLFSGLIPGKYIVYAYTKDAAAVGKVNIIADTISVDGYNKQKVAVLHNYALLADPNTILK